MATVAQYPEMVTGMFPVNEKNEAGFYAVNMYTLGTPHTVVVDEFMPFKPGKAAKGLKGMFSSEQDEVD